MQFLELPSFDNNYLIRLRSEPTEREQMNFFVFFDTVIETIVFSSSSQYLHNSFIINLI
jgi:hypothetical protein